MYRIVNLSTDCNCDLCITNNNRDLIYLFQCDWNGEIYVNSCIADKENNCYKEINKGFRPIFRQIDEDNFEIFGFEEVI